MLNGYKVVCVSKDGSLVSAVSGSLSEHRSIREPRVVEYRLNKIVYPSADHGPLAVFSMQDAAMQFYNEMRRERWLELNHIEAAFAVYACQYEPSDSLEMWYTYDYTKMTFHVKWSPVGTVLAKSVTLLSCIEGISSCVSI